MNNKSHSLKKTKAFAAKVALATSIAALSIQPLAAQTTDTFAAPAQSADAFRVFTPQPAKEQHTIDYEIWDYALKKLVLPMGPSLRQRPVILSGAVGSRIRNGHNSLYRVEGSMVAFSQLDERAINSFTEYRLDLERIGNMVDIPTLPRNEQLAYWFNLHNVMMVEQIAHHWPMRRPREFDVDGIALDDLKLVTIRGVDISMRDIREHIVYSNWRDPRVIYGFWRGEIGSPSLEREAFNGLNVGGLLSLKAQSFVNSLRGTQKRGDTLHVSTLFEEAAAFYFDDFENDVRAHILEYANEDVVELVGRTNKVVASVREYDIADLAGGRRDSIAQQSARPGLPAGAYELLAQRREKMQRMRRKDLPTGRVYFTPIFLPGDDPTKADVQ